MNQVTVEMMMQCRDDRAAAQHELLSRYHKPVISFSMNIPGPVKTSPAVEQAFRIGCRRIIGGLYGMKAEILEKRILYIPTGPEALICADADACILKAMALEIEDQDELGRLFDIDIINTDGLKAGRNASGKQERRCLICGCPAKQCASRRVHSLGELQAKVSSILDKAVSDDSANRVSVLAVKALLYEVTATPKPGLVDRNNNGSHKDMDFFTFMGSSAVLCPYFKSAFLTGLGSASPADSFVRLRELGKEAERQMFYETKGINTHKGAVFSLGIMCCAVGLAGYGHWGNTDEILRNCALMTKGIMASVCKAGAGITAGQMLYQKHRIAGIRGEAESGFPTVQNYGLKVLEKLLSDGKSWDEASANALMAIIAAAQDTNMMARSSVEKAEEEAEKAGKLIESGFAAMSEIRKVDELYIRDNLSPGGSADLLACGLFLHFLKKEEELD